MADAPICPVCGSEAREQSTRYGARHACCGLWSWKGRPLVSAETHAARQAAHAAFDPLWRDGGVPRGRAYKLLQQEMGLSEKDCHMTVMDAETARRVPAAAAAIKDALSRSRNVRTANVGGR